MRLIWRSEGMLRQLSMMGHPAGLMCVASSMSAVGLAKDISRQMMIQQAHLTTQGSHGTHIERLCNRSAPEIATGIAGAESITWSLGAAPFRQSRAALHSGSCAHKAVIARCAYRSSSVWDQ